MTVDYNRICLDKREDYINASSVTVSCFVALCVDDIKFLQAPKESSEVNHEYLICNVDMWVMFIGIFLLLFTSRVSTVPRSISPARDLKITRSMTSGRWFGSRTPQPLLWLAALWRTDGWVTVNPQTKILTNEGHRQHKV